MWGYGRCLFYAFWRKRERKVGEKISFFPYLACPEEEEDPQCRSKWHHLGLFCLHEQCMKRCRFGKNAPFHLKGKGGKKVSEFTLVLNL
jgi:hypothetical protein